LSVLPGPGVGGFNCACAAPASSINTAAQLARKVRLLPSADRRPVRRGMFFVLLAGFMTQGSHLRLSVYLPSVPPVALRERTIHSGGQLRTSP